MEGSIPLSVMRAIDNYGSFINASRCYLFKVFAGLAPDVVRKRNFDSAECDEPAILERPISGGLGVCFVLSLGASLTTF